MANGGDGCIRTRERESEGEERKNPGESERVRGRAWRRSRASRRRGERQAGRRAGGVARWRARAGHTPLPLSRTKTTEEEVGWAGQLAGPEAPGKRPR